MSPSLEDRLVELRAVGSRRNIHAYRDRQPGGSNCGRRAIAAAIRGLLDFPESGRPGRVTGTRELVIVGTPYIAAYQLRTDTIRILRVLHGAQRWPDDLPDG